MTRRAIGVEILIVAGLLVFGGSVASFAVHHFSGEPSFYQEEFGPAVMVAAGRGFVHPVVTPGSPLADFLQLKRGQLSGADAAAVEVTTPDQFQEATRYLMLAVGYTWKILGISWAAVGALAAILYALSVAACYCICRMWVSRPLAAGGALFMCFSPLQLEQLPHVRDYSKAPFILIAILIVVLVATRRLSRPALGLLSVACGVVIGVGLGFKMDVTIMAPVFVASLFLFRDRRPWTGLVEKTAAAGAFMLALVLTAAPVLTHLSKGGSNGFHVIILGYSDQFDSVLGLNRPVYSLLPFYSDRYLTTVVKSYGERRTGQFPAFPSAEYDAASRAYWLSIVRHFPADVATRALGAANGILNAPFNEPALNFMTPPATRINPVWNVLTNQVPHRARIAALYEWMTVLNGWGALAGVVLVCAGAARSSRLGLFAAWIVVVLTAYASFQFAPRHFFHLEVIPVLGLVVAVQLLARRPWPERRSAARFAAAVGALAVATAASVALLRAYQQIHLRRLFQQYVDSPRQSVGPAYTDVGDGVWQASWQTPARSIAAAGSGAVSTSYYVLEFDGVPQPEMSVIGYRYKSTTPATNFSRVGSMSEGAGVNRVFIAAYGDPPAWEFDGLDLPTGIKERVRGIYLVTHPERLPLLLDLRLPPGWRDQPLSQTLRMGEGGLSGDVQLLGSAYGSSVPRVALIGRVDSLGARPDAGAVASAYTKDIHVGANGIEMDGAAESQSAYLLQFKPVDVKAPAALLVKGHLSSGGFALGLLKNGQWYRQLGTGTPGDFIGVIDITESGTYTPLITNATARDHDHNRFVLSRFGIVSINPARP